MIRKFFAFDKNYLLEEAQLILEKELIRNLIDRCKAHYLSTQNPLGLVDDTIAQILEHQTDYVPELNEFYLYMCGMYRYRHGNNQLELLFCGSDHLAKYKSDWSEAFHDWTELLCQSPYFLRAVLELTVFYPSDRKAELAANRMKAYLEQHFGMKIYRYRGIVEMNVA